RLENIAVRRGGQRGPPYLGAQPGMNIIDTHLYARRTDGWDIEHLPGLAPADVASVDDSTVRLLNAVSVDRIVEEECEIRIQVELVILDIAVGKQLPAPRTIIVIVEPSGPPKRFSSFRRIDRPESIDRANGDGPQRDFSGRIPLRLVERPGQAHLRAARRIERGLGQGIEAKVAVRAVEGTIRIVSLCGDQASDLVLGRRQHEQVSLLI